MLTKAKNKIKSVKTLVPWKTNRDQMEQATHRRESAFNTLEKEGCAIRKVKNRINMRSSVDFHF